MLAQSGPWAALVHLPGGGFAIASGARRVALEGQYGLTRGRNRPSLALAALWVFVFSAAAVFSSSLGSGVAHAEEEPTPEVTESPAESPPGPIQCPPGRLCRTAAPGWIPVDHRPGDGRHRWNCRHPRPVDHVDEPDDGYQHDRDRRDAFQDLGNATYYISYYDSEMRFWQWLLRRRLDRAVEGRRDGGGAHRLRRVHVEALSFYSKPQAPSRAWSPTAGAPVWTVSLSRSAAGIFRSLAAPRPMTAVSTRSPVFSVVSSCWAGDQVGLSVDRAGRPEHRSPTR